MTYHEFIKELQQWMKGCYTAHSSLQPPRDWCRFGAPGLTQAELNTHFTTKRLDKNVVLLTKAKSRAATSYKVAEIDLTHGMHKSMVARHKPRIMYYRDDVASKHYHNWKAISIGVGGFLAQKTKSEKANGGT